MPEFSKLNTGTDGVPANQALHAPSDAPRPLRLVLPPDFGTVWNAGVNGAHQSVVHIRFIHPHTVDPKNSQRVQELGKRSNEQIETILRELKRRIPKAACLYCDGMTQAYADKIQEGIGALRKIKDLGGFKKLDNDLKELEGALRLPKNPNFAERLRYRKAKESILTNRERMQRLLTVQRELKEQGQKHITIKLALEGLFTLRGIEDEPLMTTSLSAAQENGPVADDDLFDLKTALRASVPDQPFDWGDPEFARSADQREVNLVEKYLSRTEPVILVHLGAGHRLWRHIDQWNSDHPDIKRNLIEITPRALEDFITG